MNEKQEKTLQHLIDKVGSGTIMSFNDIYDAVDKVEGLMSPMNFIKTLTRVSRGRYIVAYPGKAKEIVAKRESEIPEEVRSDFKKLLTALKQQGVKKPKKKKKLPTRDVWKDFVSADEEIDEFADSIKDILSVHLGG